MDNLLASATTILDSSNLGTIVNFKIILLSIVIEALPFVLFSVLVSAILNNFVSEDTIRKIIPRSKFLMKGVPLPAAVAFMLAAPIINPVVTAATSFAFKANGNMVFFRLGTAFLIACLAGWLTSILFKDNELKATAASQSAACNCCSHHAADHKHITQTFAEKLTRTIYDASGEFFEMGKYLIIGAMIGALSQVLLTRTALLAVGQDPFLSIGVMM
ncbi:MAG: Protein of unknown function transrane, partial [Anaerospora sp.]|nr:Protein of unknown function transrane [Anaerospora sp.]